MRRRSAPVLLGLGALVASYLVAALTLPQAHPVMGFFRTYVHSAVMVAAAVIGVRVALRAERERLAWSLVAAGLIAFAAGEVIWRFAYADDPSPPSPSLADFCWLATYPAFYGGLMLLVRARVAVFAGSAWLDGLIAATATAALGVAFYLLPVLDSSEGDAVAVAVTMAYPLASVLLWVLLLAALALDGWRLSRSFGLLVAGQVAVTVGDASLALATAAGNYVEGRWPDVMWPLGVLLIAAAALEPPPLRRGRPVVGWRSVAVPGVFAGVAMGIELAEDILDLPLSVDVLVSLTFLLVIARAGLAMRDNIVLLQRFQAEATTDSLTGLGNRRALLADLDDALDSGRAHTLALFDLDGFKAYNDTRGHAAGDELLARFGRALSSRISPGRCYRLGGDEFCVLVPVAGEPARALVAAATEALSEDGEGLRVRASHGAATLPAEARDASAALQLVDRRMYAQKHLRRAASEDAVAGVLSATAGGAGEPGRAVRPPAAL